MRIDFYCFLTDPIMTVWTEEDFHTAILYWKDKISLQEAMDSNPLIPMSSWKLRKLQLDQIEKGIRKKGNDLSPIGKKVFANYNLDKKHKFFYPRISISMISILVFYAMLYFSLIKGTKGAYIHWMHQPISYSTSLNHLYIGNRRMTIHENACHYAVKSPCVNQNDIALSLDDLSQCFPNSFDYIEIDEDNLMLNGKEKNILCKILPRILKPNSQLLVTDLHHNHPFMNELLSVSSDAMNRHFSNLYGHHEALSLELSPIRTFSSPYYIHHVYKK